MNIGLLFPSIYASEKLYGERIFAPRDLLRHLTNGLVSRGHTVYVYTASDFKTNATLIASSLDSIISKPAYYKFRNLEKSKKDVLDEEFVKHSFELDVISSAFKDIKKHRIDILHSYHDSSLFLTHYFNRIADVPVLYSLHDPLPPQGSFEYQELLKFKEHSYVALSDSMKRSDLPLNFAATIYHGIALSDFEFQEKPSDYLLFMGRLVPEKGLHSAIEASLSLNMRLEIGTQFPDTENDYFVSEIKPFLDNPLLGEPGMVNGSDKVLLYKQARALLFPIEWEEPFGMVMIEAMACGTPVIAYNRGSVSEIVRDGLTGFIIDQDDTDRPGKGSWIIKKKGIEGLTEALKRIGEIDRRMCRKHVEENFTLEKMVEEYEKVYQKLLNT